MQLGKVHNVQRDSLLEELCLRGIIVDPKEKLTVLKQVLMKNEHPDNDDDWKTEKFFKPMLFAAPDWSKDVVDETFKQLDVLRRSRLEE